MKTFKAKILLKNGSVQEVRVQADNFWNAKDMIDAQYGNPTYFLQPVEA